MLDRVATDLRELNPSYFSLVMATGIVSMAAHYLGLPHVAQGLFILNNVLYAWLWLMSLLRLGLYRSRLLRDLTGHGTGPGFLTVVAGTCVLGVQHAVIGGNAGAATLLWYLGVGLWCLLMYTFFTCITVADSKPDIEAGLSGAWLLIVVSTQSLAVLGTLVAPDGSPSREIVLFVALTTWLLGCLFYLLLITLIIYRLSFFRLPPESLTPPYWINMGAVAITTLAGSRLILVASSWTLLDDLRPFLVGLTLLFWATATWWVPLLVLLGIWRHVARHFPLRYHPQYWSIVFPLGMYTVATFQLSRAIELPWLLPIPRAFVYVALVAWGVTFAAMLATIGQRYLRRAAPNGTP